MIVNKCDRGKCGIYCIRNTMNQKIYVGKAKDIFNRINGHISALRRRSKDENRHLINAWFKYGEDAFEYFIIEELDFDEDLLREREDYWIVKYDAINREKGYNLRRDSSTGCFVSEETRQLKSQVVMGEKNPNYGNKWSEEQKLKMSELKKQQYLNGEVKYNSDAPKLGIAARNKKWTEHPELKEQMKDKVSSQTTVYKYYQYDKKTNELIKVWDSVHDILKEHPEWKRHNIYAACSGEKPSIYGYKWKKLSKYDIVQSVEKSTE